MSKIGSFEIEGRHVRYVVTELPSSIKADLENCIGQAKRRVARDFQPGTALRIVLNRGLEKLYIDGEEINWKSGEIPFYWNEEEDKSLFDILMEKVLEQKSASRIILRKPEYQDVFEEWAPKHVAKPVEGQEENPT